MKKAVITILGTVGGSCDREDNKKGIYNPNISKVFYKSEVEGIVDSEAKNTLPILIQNYPKHDIVTIHTLCAKEIQEKVLKAEEVEYQFDDKFLIKDEKNFNEIFELMDKAMDSYDEVIIDVSHGFRHLPILMTVDMIIQNFQNTDKIQKILFAKEVTKHESNQQGLYEIIDLKPYLDIANIAFVLTAFERNYTVSSHIGSKNYESLIKSLNDFSNDIMALNLNNLFTKSSESLITELDKIKDVSISKQAQNLKETIAKLTAYQGKKYYQTYFDLSKDLFKKNYMLLSLALLFESIRMYIKTTIKKEHKELVEKVENTFNRDLYKIGDFFKNLSWKKYEQYIDPKTKKQILQITQKEYTALKNEFDKLKILDLYKNIDKKRNNLAHANTNGNFQTIRGDIEKLIEEYEKFISPKNSNDLQDKFKNR